MTRDPLLAPDFKPTFSGHETFPLRQLWLRKAYREVADYFQDYNEPAPKTIFSDEGSISRFGAGKNMVYAMRHWAVACGIITELDNGYTVSPLGKFLFDSNSGVDPFQERVATAWLIQWILATNPRQATTWYWAFNRFNYSSFSRGDLERSLMGLINTKGYKRLTTETIKRDVQCFIRSYCTTKPFRDEDFRTDSVDDLAEPVLSELGLISAVEDGSFRFRRGPKMGLPAAVFNYALHQFWETFSPAASTMSFETIAYEPGSPASVFKLDEGSLADRLFALEESTGGKYAWSDTAGLRQIIRRGRGLGKPLDLLGVAYQKQVMK